MRGSPRERLAQRCSGQATAEFALLLPMVVVAMLAIVQVARVALDAVALAHAVREAARAFSIDPRTAAARAAAEKATKLLKPERIRVRVSGEARPGGLATVRLDYRSPTDVPLVGGLVGDTRLQAEVTVVVEAWHHSFGSSRDEARP
ncbi:MAG: hypothetical protein KatS3mg008_1534 [Acidimicrobiales bacterium]|nr:MAG: hypothetical protein KatS3mg008_1534 [Acidimicrobiales bacterium]